MITVLFVKRDDLNRAVISESIFNGYSTAVLTNISIDNTHMTVFSTSQYIRSILQQIIPEP